MSDDNLDLKAIAESRPELMEAFAEQYKRHIKQNLLAWCEHVLAPSGQSPAKHHRLIISELQALAESKFDRLMIFLPPGSAKSSYASVLFPPWFMNRKIHMDVIAASNTVSLAEQFGQRARDITSEHGNYLGNGLASESTAKSFWRMQNDSRYIAIGVGGSIVGRRADCLIGKTIVETIDGLKRLDKVKEDDLVLSYDFFNNCNAFHRIRAVVKRETDVIWQIKTSSKRTVEATGNHQFYVLDWGWVAAENIAVGDTLAREDPNGIKYCGDSVSSVKRIQRKETVYDIDVEHTHNFFANGILVHNCLLIDDPLNSEQTDKTRESVWNWYQTDAITRLKPGGRVVIIMTRWHQDDLAGRLLALEPNRWRVISLPAIAESENDALGRAIGEPLWMDGNYGYGQGLLKIRESYENAGTTRVWSALYQQRPAPEGGTLFKTENVTTIEAAPAGMRLVRAWDLAATKQAGSRDPDWTVGLLVGRREGRFVVCDVVRLRGGPQDVERAILATAQRDGKSVRIGLAQDPGQAGKAQIAYLASKLLGWTVDSSPETGAKETRAMPVASQCNVGNLSVVRSAWNRIFLEELSAFPNGTKDDQVDALSRAFSMLGEGSYDTSMSWVG